MEHPNRKIADPNFLRRAQPYARAPRALFTSIFIAMTWPVLVFSVICALAAGTAALAMTAVALSGVVCVLLGVAQLALIVILSHHCIHKLSAVVLTIWRTVWWTVWRTVQRPFLSSSPKPNRWELATRMLSRQEGNAGFDAEVKDLLGIVGSSATTAQELQDSMGPPSPAI